MFGFETLEFYKVAFEIYIGDKLVQQQEMQAPRAILEASFIQTANQIANDKRPMKIKMSRPQTIWDEFANKQKVLKNEIEFKNNAMIVFEDNK